MENSQRFVEFVEENVANRNQIIPIDIYDKAIKLSAFSKKEMYRSYYSFDESFYRYVEQHNSVRQYDGPMFLDSIILDIDKGPMDCEQHKDYVEQCIADITEIGVKDEDINIWFSGNGYHINIKNVFGFKSNPRLNETVKFTLEKYFPFADSIYDKTRIIRSPWSYNSKSELYKIYIPLDKFLEMDVSFFKEAAQSKEHYTEFNKDFDSLFKDNDTLPYLEHLLVDKEVVVHKKVQERGQVSSVVSCMQHVFNEGPVEGDRNKKIMRMVSSYKRAGLPFLASLAIMHDWANGELGHNEVVRTVTNIYEGNYQYGCQDVIMNAYCDNKCIYYKNKNYTLDIKGVDELEDSFMKYIKEQFSQKSIDLAEVWDVPSYQFRPGELVIFSGDTGMGKSALVQNIVAKAKKDTLFLSLEMPEQLTFRRFIQIVMNKSKEWVHNMFTSNDNVSFKELLGHIKIMTIAPTVNAIKEIVAQHEPNVLVIDTVDEMQVDYVRGEIEKQNQIIDGLKAIAQKHNTIVFAVHHINKAAATGGNLGLHSLKGSSNVVQKADKVLIVSGDREEVYRTITSAKSRDEGQFEMLAKFKYETMKFEKALI